MVKAQDIRHMTIDEIDAKIDSSKKDLFNLRVQAKTGKLEKQHRMNELKKDIARLETIKQELTVKEQKKEQ